jgi:hypothetical protein
MAGGPIAELGGRTWPELEVLEHEAGQLMFPAKLRQRLPSGEVKVTPVRVRVPTLLDQARARTETAAWTKELKVDRTLDKDLFDQLEQIVLLSKAIRTADTFAQFAKHDELAERDDGSLQDIQEQLAAFKAAQDPREPVSTEEDVWRTIAAVAKESSIDPLAERAGREQPSIVVRMALEACRSPTGQRWLQSFGISIPASSPSTSTSGS